jgi:hypothetical protein
MILPATAGYSVILPYSFSNYSVITQFTAYFASLEPVHLQLYRPNGSDTFFLVFDQLVVPSAANQIETIIMKYCVIAMAGDYVGFTSMTGPASIAYTTPKRNANYLPLGIRGATASGPFTITQVPFAFSLSAEYYFGQSC